MGDKPKNLDEATEAGTATRELPVCGIVMPISAIDGCSESHWAEVYAIQEAAIENAGFRANLVSNANDVGIIQQRIIQNLYENPVVVCDVSAKNPNVMFELGLRLAFDKPTIIVKDDRTSYSFDTGQIEHLEYPRDLRFSRIVEFKESLTAKIKATHEKATSDPNYTTFLKHFGAFKVASLDAHVISKEDFIIRELGILSQQVAGLSVARVERGNSVPLNAEANGDFTVERVEWKKYLDSRLGLDRDVLAYIAAQVGAAWSSVESNGSWRMTLKGQTAPQQRLVEALIREALKRQQSGGRQ